MIRHKRQLLPGACIAIGLLLATLAGALPAAEEATIGTHAPALVTAEILESMIVEVEGVGEIDEKLKSELLELYRKTLSNLLVASSNRDAARALQEAARTLPAETVAIREEMVESSIATTEDTFEADLSAPLPELESLLQKEKADLAAVEARSADFAKRLGDEVNRPSKFRQRLTEAKAEQDEVK